MPLVVNLDNGETRTFDLELEPEADAWADLRSTAADRITGLAIKAGSVLHVLALPRSERFERLRIDAELVLHRDGSGRVVAERARLYADDLLATVLVYRGRRPQMVKYTLERPGTPRFIPNLDGAAP